MATSDRVGRTYCVAVSGDDANDGIMERPFGTIQHAADIMEPGDICFVREGVYKETVRLTRSGAAERPIRFVACPGEIVTLSGTESVTGSWAVHDGSILKTQVDTAFEQLFIDGRMMPEARFPKGNLDDPLDRSCWATTGPGTVYARVVDPELAGTGVDWTDAVAVLNIGHQYFSWMRLVRNHSAGADTFEYDRDLKHLGQFADKPEHPTDWVGQRYFLYGSLGGLTAPGEWFLDRETMTLYLWPPEGVDISTCSVEVKAREYAFEAQGVEYVNIEGFHFFGTTFRFLDSHHCVVDGCHLRYPNYTRYIPEPTIDPRKHACSFMSGSGNVIRNSSLADSQTRGFVMAGSDNTCENNLVHGFGWTGTMCPGVVVCATDNPRPDVEMADEHGLARFNTIHDGGNLCMTFRGLRNSIAEYNHIYNGGRCCKDVSLIYTFYPTAAGTEFRYNWVHGVHTPDIAIGIRCDYQARDVKIHHNVVWDCGWEAILLWGDRHTLCNNLTFDNGRTDILLWARAEPDIPYMVQWPRLDAQNANTLCANNWAQRIVPGREKHHGLVLTCRTSNNYQGDDPMLEDPEHYDFRPKAGSPLIDAGVEVPGFTDGYLGEAPDIGAYEYGGEKWIPGCRNSLWILADGGSRSTHGEIRLRLALALPPLEATSVTARPSDDSVRVTEGETLTFDVDNWAHPRPLVLSLPETAGETSIRFVVEPSGSEIIADVSAIDPVLGERYPFVMLPAGPGPKWPE